MSGTTGGAPGGSDTGGRRRRHCWTLTACLIPTLLACLVCGGLVSEWTLLSKRIQRVESSWLFLDSRGVWAAAGAQLPVQKSLRVLLTEDAHSSMLSSMLLDSHTSAHGM